MCKRKITSVHGIVKEREVLSIDQRAQGIKVENGLEQIGVNLRGVDNLSHKASELKRSGKQNRGKKLCMLYLNLQRTQCVRANLTRIKLRQKEASNTYLAKNK
jgi:hypothetical protein